MHEVTLAGLGARTSCLGFGCASLGSRFSAAQGNGALAAAYDAGLRWFDVAPAYGGGEAEAILGAFLAGRRDKVQICTKAGLLPPPQSALKRAARAALRPVAGMAGAVRTAIRGSGVSANRGVPITPKLLTSSLERSLDRLGTDHVDVYALHNADPETVTREDIVRTLEDLLAAGKTRAVAVASNWEAGKAGIRQGAPYGVVQAAQPEAGQPDPIAAAQAAGLGCVTHSVFGVAGALAALTRRIKADPSLRGQIEAAGFDGRPSVAAAALLLARARAANPNGVILVSMFSERSRSANLAGAAQPPDPAVLQLCRDLGL